MRHLRELQQCNDVVLLQKLVADHRWEERFEEMAFPAYFRGNALSRALFFGRLARLLGQLPAGGYRQVMDFGCGLGLMLPWLATRSQQIRAVDLHTDIAEAYVAGLGLHPGVHFSDQLPSQPERDGFDLILALDVLEHVEPLVPMLSRLRELMAANGILAISGPTENGLYRLGRRIVGFSGEYHHCDIHQIFSAAGQAGLAQFRRVSWPLPGPLALFEIGIFRRA